MKIRKSLVLSILLFSGLLIACGSSESSKGDYILKGQLDGLNAKQLYLIDLLQAKAGPVDTALVKEDGSFAFDYQTTKKGFYRVTLNEQINLVLPLQSGEEVMVSGNVSNPGEIEVSGTKDAVRMMKFNHFLQANFQEEQEMNRQFQQLQGNPNQDSIVNEFRLRFKEMEAKKHQMIKDLIDEDPTLFSNLALIEQLPAEGEGNLAYYQKVKSGLADEFSNSRFYKNFTARLVELSRFAKGSEVPEINLPSPTGEPIALSSLRGKVVLIDFWASWCKPCRRENPNVVAAYEKFKDKGFEIYGVSLDRNKDAWIRAIEQDRLNWTQVSDLKFWQSEAARDYGVSSIPFALLIDEEGKVIGKNLRGPALHKKLAEVLN